MRRKSTRSSSKASPEKTKDEKPPKKLRRTRRQKRSSSESDSDDDAPLSQTIEHHSEDSKGFDDDAVQHNNETQKNKNRAVSGTPERTSKRLRKKSVTLPEEDEEKSTRRSKRRGGTPKLEDIDEEDVDIEEKRAKGKSKGKNKSKIDQTSQISETEIPSDNSENAQVTAQSPHIDNVANNDDADNVGVNQMDDGSDTDKKRNNVVEKPRLARAETESEAEVKPPDLVDDTQTIKESPNNAANADEGSITNDSSSVPNVEKSSTTIEPVTTEAESIAKCNEKEVDTDGIKSNKYLEENPEPAIEISENSKSTTTDICGITRIEADDKLGTDVEIKEFSKETEAVEKNEVDRQQAVKKKEETPIDKDKNEGVESHISTRAESTSSIKEPEKCNKEEFLEESKNEQEIVNVKTAKHEAMTDHVPENNEITAKLKNESTPECEEIPAKVNDELSEKRTIDQNSKKFEVKENLEDTTTEILEKTSEIHEESQVEKGSETSEKHIDAKVSEKVVTQEVPEKLKEISEPSKTEEEVPEKYIKEVSEKYEEEVPEKSRVEEVAEKCEEEVSKIIPPEVTTKNSGAQNKDFRESAVVKQMEPDQSKSTTEMGTRNEVVEDEKMDVDESIDFTKPPDDSMLESCEIQEKTAAYKTLLEEIIQKNKDERPIPERRKINIKNKRRRSDNSDGQGDTISTKKSWNFKINLTLITSDVFIGMYPELSLIKEEEVKLERRDRRPTVSEYERKVEEHIGDSREVKESEAAVENIIAMNRKISIVDDDASKLRPPPSPAKNEKSAVLYITNLVRPFTIKQLRELLERTGNIKEEGFWTDRIKSKCYVQYQTVEEAEATRNALHGVHWPICNGKKLIIDYSTVEDLEMAKNPPPVVPVVSAVPEKENQEPDIAPVKKSHKDELDLEKEAKLKANNSWELDSVKEEAAHVRRSRSKDRMEKRRYSRSRHSRSSSEADYGKKKQKKVEEAIPQRAMDDLFRKTEATPCIYWQPLSPEEIALKQQQRLERMAEHKRRMETQTRNKRGPEHARGGPYRRRY